MHWCSCDCYDNFGTRRQISRVYGRSDIQTSKSNSSSNFVVIYTFQNYRLLLYKLDKFQHGASEMFVANDVDSFDDLIRKSLHGFIDALLHEITIQLNVYQTTFFSMQVVT